VVAARPGLTAAIAICTRRRPELLSRALEAAQAAAGQVAGTGLIVVEQGGTAGAVAATRAGALHVADRGSGVSRARNLAAAACTADVLLYTDDDCVVPERWVQDHLAVLVDPALDASFGPVGGLARPDQRDDPAAIVRRHDRESPPWIVGHSSNMAVRRTSFLSVGGFDERIGPGSNGVQAGEDADLIARLLAGGCIVASGTGEPVRHIEWRTTEEVEDILVSYERGAGVWLGAALRARRRHAPAHLRSRLRLVRGRMGERWHDKRRRSAIQLGAGFAAGFARGVLLAPWPTADARENMAP
jgi:hypothetical protein